MKLGFVAAVAVAGLTTGAMAAGQDFTVDIGGVNSWDLEGDVDNETMSIDLGAMLGTPGQPVTVNGLGWDVTIEVSDNGSWFSEATISFGDVAGSPDIFLSPGAGDDFNDPAPMDYSGDIKLADAGLDDIVLSDGVLELEFFESFDDVDGEIDATYLAGSTLTIQVVPAPGAMALLGVAGLASRRRRRRS